MTTMAVGPGPVERGGSSSGSGGGSDHGRRGASPRAVMVVHDVTGAAAAGELGTIGDRMTQHGIRFDLITAGEQPFPAPESLDLIVIMGSDKSANDDTIPWLPDELSYLRAAVRVGTPVLGICFGGQLLARALGGTVRR